jgi:chemotaxis protein methyltransferase CheR
MRLEDYFYRVKGQYAVREEVKRPVRFMILDLMKPPALRHLDIILCRNVLIYFEKGKQHLILSIFNECLRKDGFLVLGKSEAIMGSSETGFVPFNRKERIYRKEKETKEAEEEGKLRARQGKGSRLGQA